LVIGGGTIGLSLAYEATRRGMSVRLIERGQTGQESSWAGAGILPSARPHADNTPTERLAALSHSLHPAWSEALREETGIDNGFRRCGGLYLERSDEPASDLARELAAWRRQGLPFRELSSDQLPKLEPAIAPDSPTPRQRRAVELPEDGQLRNPRHLRALAAASQRRGAVLSPGVAAEDFVLSSDKSRMIGVATTEGLLSAGAYCLSSGCWSGALARRAGWELPIRPLKGQIALLQCERPLLRRVINVGPRYLVPRDDGRVLVGSTEEEAGFDKRTTAGGIGGLIEFALRLAPALASASVERTWAGLRPATSDGLPFLGRLGALSNAYVAAGHFRNGLSWSPATAQVMCQLVRGESPSLDLAPFRIDR
jgi:glycine oxidase